MTRALVIIIPITITAAAMPLSLAGCSDDPAGAPDAAAADAATFEAGEGPVTNPVTDGPLSPDSALPADSAPAADSAPVGDGPLPLDGAPAQDSAPGKQCTSDKDCKVFEDCCDCRPILAWQNPGICKKACKVKACQAEYFLTKPEAYCVAGKCWLGEGAALCKADGDCALLNDCCNCMAVPKGAKTYSCPITSCFVPTCTAKGFASAKAGCVSSRCRLRP